MSTPCKFLPLTCPYWKPNQLFSLLAPPSESPQSNKHAGFITPPDSDGKHRLTAQLSLRWEEDRLSQGPSFGHMTSNQCPERSGNAAPLPEDLPKNQFWYAPQALVGISVRGHVIRTGKGIGLEKYTMPAAISQCETGRNKQNNRACGFVRRCRGM